MPVNRSIVRPGALTASIALVKLSGTPSPQRTVQSRKVTSEALRMLMPGVSCGSSAVTTLVGRLSNTAPG